jgi:peptidyl-prolyl cis-trans isomerase A (cyclophilin A)
MARLKDLLHQKLHLIVVLSVICTTSIEGACEHIHPAVAPSEEVRVVLATTAGDIEISIDTIRAPQSARAFLTLIDNGGLAAHGYFYRTVRANNDRGQPSIEVIQGGIRDPLLIRSLSPVEHETTRTTGLSHVDGTISLARGAVGTASGATFFICVGDQHALDLGGGRDPNHDGQGFAAFGRVVRGMDVVRQIHQMQATAPTPDPYMEGQILNVPVRIVSAFRKDPIQAR